MKRILFLAVAAAAVGCGQDLRVEETVDRQKDQLALHVFKSMAEISKTGNGRVHFRAEQLFTSEQAASKSPKEFDLAPGQSFVQQDHHSRTSYKVAAINPSTVVLDYESEFSHVSFGKDLITKDKGSFEVSYK